ncbi:hypothetical protein ACLOJK_021761 [Asimina triloba]
MPLLSSPLFSSTASAHQALSSSSSLQKPRQALLIFISASLAWKPRVLDFLLVFENGGFYSGNDASFQSSCVELLEDIFYVIFVHFPSFLLISAAIEMPLREFGSEGFRAPVMKRLKNDAQSGRRLRLYHVLFGTAALYLVFITLKFPQFLEIAAMLSGDDSFVGIDGSDGGNADVLDQSKRLSYSAYKDNFHRRLDRESRNQNAQLMIHVEQVVPLHHNYGRITKGMVTGRNLTSGVSEFDKMTNESWTLGLRAWEEVENSEFQEINQTALLEAKAEACPSSVSMSGAELAKVAHIMFLPCGLAAGSSITVIGTPHFAHREYVPQLLKLRQGDGVVQVSQFQVELQGLKAVDGEDPPRILHLNPRLKGDWSQLPVIEHNTCYRMQWGTAQRCNGMPSKDDDDTVDGFGKCEKWIRDDIEDLKESRTTSWLRRFIGRAKKPEMTWPFPFVEGRLFVLTIRAGVEGYHIHVGGRHLTSFAYRTGFTLEDATGLAVIGNVDVHSIYATSLPISHRSFSTQQVLEMKEKWKSNPLPGNEVELFIGILSATNHFAERMAIRKTWMQSGPIKSSEVVARFFIALNPRKEVNAMLKKEADYFGDIVILPFMDRYELVVLKTIAICEYGVQNLSAVYIMKCDDDTFVRVDTVLKEIRSISPEKSLYMGNLNLLHRPLRNGKWAVTYEEWPEEIYPPYANGPGYIISSDISRFVVSQHANQSLRPLPTLPITCRYIKGNGWIYGPVKFKAKSTLDWATVKVPPDERLLSLWLTFYASLLLQLPRCFLDLLNINAIMSQLFKMEDYGCMEDYYTAHYQSPRQMICLWDNSGVADGTEA